MEQIEEIKYKNYSAKINLSRGANCISLIMDSNRVLREPDYGKGLDNPYLYGMPILFPVNRISGGRFEFEGREYSFPINETETNCHLHGNLHQSQFVTVSKKNNEIICSYNPDADDPYMKIGQKYRIEIAYKLDEEGFAQAVSVVNLSDMNMPVMLGFHTTFNTLFAGGKESETFVYADIDEEYERNMDNYLPTGKILEFDEVSKALADGTFMPFDKPISRHYMASKGGNMVIYDKYNNLSLVYENDEKYQFRLIYNRGDFICLEPQNCMADCPNVSFGREKAGFDFVKPNETKKYYSIIRVLKGDMRKHNI